MLKWGIVGCGDVVERKGGPSLSAVADSSVIAVMSRNLLKARSFAKRLGAKRYYNRLDHLLTDDEVNAVYIATPVFLHCEQTVRAAEAGKHILCEKPMAMNVAECRRMIDASLKNNVTLMIAYYRRFHPNVLKIKELIANREIGEIILARVQNNSPFRPPAENEVPWRLNRRMSGGGVLMDLGSHRLDLLLFLFGEADQISGYARSISDEFPVDDSVSFAMEFTSGVQAIGNINWNIPFPADSLEVYGSSGKLTADPLSHGTLLLETRNGRTEFSFSWPEYPHVGLVQDFVTHLRTGAPVCSAGESGMQTNRLIAEIYRRRSKTA